MSASPSQLIEIIRLVAHVYTVFCKYVRWVWHVNEFATCEIAEKKHVTHVQRYVTSIFVSCRQTMPRCNVPNNVAKLNCMFTNNLYGSHP